MNKVMTDTLLDITRASLEEYASYIAKNSNGVIEVSGTGLKDVTCNYPERKEGEPPRERPMFGVDVGVRREKVVMNQEEIDRSKAEISEWMKSDEAKKPKAKVRERGGKGEGRWREVTDYAYKQPSYTP